MKLEAELKLVNGHFKITILFQRNSEVHVTLQCNKKMKILCKEISLKLHEICTKFWSYYTIEKVRIMLSRDVKKLMIIEVAV